MKTKLFLLTIIFFGSCLLSAAQIIHVPADQPTIQAGIDAATDKDTVLVANGTYLENINYSGKAIMVASHFIMDGDTNHINNTIIDGSQPANPDYGSVVTFITDEDTNSVICGFTITGGGGMTEPVYGTRIGGGIVCYYATAKIIHNKITGNAVTSSTDAWGGGLYRYIETGDHWIIIENNTITANQCTTGTGLAAGGGILIVGNARVCENIIENNQCISSSGDADGGGIYHQSMNTPANTLILKNNLVSNNTLSAENLVRGGGVAIFFSQCLINQNTINMNSLTGNITVGCGLFVIYSESATVTGNVINHNLVYPVSEYWGVGCMVAFPAGSTLFDDNEFSGNWGPVTGYVGLGGGLAIRDAEMSNISITDNIFRNNRGWFGGGFYSKSSYNLKLQNNLFYDNESYEGGAIGMYIPSSTEDARPSIVNNTITENSATTRGGGVHLNCETNLPEFLNCIFYQNSAPVAKDINFIGSSDPINISYSDIDSDNITGPWTGEGNINANPQFIALDPYYHLSASSPCRDTGIINLNTPTVDFDGHSRPDPAFSLIDIGADEYYEIPAVPNALYPVEQDSNYFIAVWQESLWAQGYYLDVAYNEDFTNMLPDYDNFDVGNETTQLVENLQPEQFYYYRVRGYNDAGVSDNSNKIDVYLSVGLEELLIQNSALKIQNYPNPTSGIFNLQFTVYNLQRISLKIYDVHGREVALLLDEMVSAGKHVVRFDTSGLPNGIYVVRMTAGDKVATGKVVVQ